MQKGTALIYALLITSIITAIGAGMAKLSINEIRMARLASESITAYYGAEAGLEDGLARWRWNRNVEVPKGATEKDKNAKDFNLEQGVKYQLKIWYKADRFGKFYNLSESDKSGTLTKNQVREFDVSDTNLTGIYIKYEVINANTTPHPPQNIQHGVEVIQVDKEGNDWSTNFYDQTQDTVASQGKGITVDKAGSNIKIIRIKPWDTDIKFALRANPFEANIDSGYTYIESTGIYRDTKRKLVAKIDRTSGTILNVYDFLFYGDKEITQ